MEHQILAPRSGKISRIHARTGDQVSNNQTLVSFDDEKGGVNDNTKRDTMRLKKGAAWITLNRPKSRNALSATLVNELYGHIEDANNNEQVRAIVLTGNGSAFCAGADLKSPPGHLVDGKKNIPYPEVLNAILESRKPVIAAVNGRLMQAGWVL